MTIEQCGFHDEKRQRCVLAECHVPPCDFGEQKDESIVTVFKTIAQRILIEGGNTHWPVSQTMDGFELRCTCPSHPEQYDVYLDSQQVAYFRLRHGEFRVDVPECGGETIFRACPNGDGLFDADERQRYLTEAIQAVKAHKP